MLLMDDPLTPSTITEALSPYGEASSVGGWSSTPSGLASGSSGEGAGWGLTPQGKSKQPWAGDKGQAPKGHASSHVPQGHPRNGAASGVGQAQWGDTPTAKGSAKGGPDGAWEAAGRRGEGGSEASASSKPGSFQEAGVSEGLRGDPWGNGLGVGAPASGRRSTTSGPGASSRAGSGRGKGNSADVGNSAPSPARGSEPELASASTSLAGWESPSSDWVAGKGSKGPKAPAPPSRLQASKGASKNSNGDWPLSPEGEAGSGNVPPEDLDLGSAVPKLAPSPLQDKLSPWMAMEFGQPGSLLWRMALLDEHARLVSSWHHIPLHAAGGMLNFVCATPCDSWLRMEIAQDEDFNPMRIRRHANGAPEHYAENARCFNLGFLPQTWLDPDECNDEYGGIPFDGRPVEAIDIGCKKSRTGDVYRVKPVGALAMVEGKERLSWKLLVLGADHRLAAEVSDVSDLRSKMPEAISSVREWLRWCTVIKPEDQENVFGFNDRATCVQEGLLPVAQAHASWQLLVDDFPPGEPWKPQAQTLTPMHLQRMWSKYTSKAAHLSPIPVADTSFGSTRNYDQAWARVSPSDDDASLKDRPSSSDSSPLWVPPKPGKGHKGGGGGVDAGGAWDRRARASSLEGGAPFGCAPVVHHHSGLKGSATPSPLGSVGSESEMSVTPDVHQHLGCGIPLGKPGAPPGATRGGGVPHPSGKHHQQGLLSLASRFRVGHLIGGGGAGEGAAPAGTEGRTLQRQLSWSGKAPEPGASRGQESDGSNSSSGTKVTLEALGLQRSQTWRESSSQAVDSTDPDPDEVLPAIERRHTLTGGVSRAGLPSGAPLPKKAGSRLMRSLRAKGNEAAAADASGYAGGTLGMFHKRATGGGDQAGAFTDLGHQMFFSGPMAMQGPARAEGGFGPLALHRRADSGGSHGTGGGGGSGGNASELGGGSFLLTPTSKGSVDSPSPRTALSDAWDEAGAAAEGGDGRWRNSPVAGALSAESLDSNRSPQGLGGWKSPTDETAGKDPFADSPEVDEAAPEIPKTRSLPAEARDSARKKVGGKVVSPPTRYVEGGEGEAPPAWPLMPARTISRTNSDLSKTSRLAKSARGAVQRFLEEEDEDLGLEGRVGALKVDSDTAGGRGTLTRNLSLEKDREQFSGPLPSGSSHASDSRLGDSKVSMSGPLLEGTRLSAHKDKAGTASGLRLVPRRPPTPPENRKASPRVKGLSARAAARQKEAEESEGEEDSSTAAWPQQWPHAPGIPRESSAGPSGSGQSRGRGTKGPRGGRMPSPPSPTTAEKYLGLEGGSHEGATAPRSALHGQRKPNGPFRLEAWGHGNEQEGAEEPSEADPRDEKGGGGVSREGEDCAEGADMAWPMNALMARGRRDEGRARGGGGRAGAGPGGRGGGGSGQLVPTGSAELTFANPSIPESEPLSPHLVTRANTVTGVMGCRRPPKELHSAHSEHRGESPSIPETEPLSSPVLVARAHTLSHGARQSVTAEQERAAARERVMRRQVSFNAVVKVYEFEDEGH